MTLHEYKDDFCKRCGKCKKNLEYYQSHCVEQDLIDETWWKCEESMVDKACEWLREFANFSVNDNTGSLNEQDLVERFQQAMKGE